MREKLFLGIDHPAVASPDPERLSAWYCDVLGYTLEFRLDRASHAALPVLLLRASDGSFLEVMPEDDPTRPERTTWTPGWSHLALRVSEFDAAVSYLDSQGVRWSGAEVPATGGGRLRSFLDPDGNLLQIVSRSDSHS